MTIATLAAEDYNSRKPLSPLWPPESITVPLKYSQVNEHLKGEDLIPKYAQKGDAGCDVRANIPHTIWLGEGDRKLIPTGISVAIPEGYEIQVRPRSGLALKNGISLANCVATIDAGYRGEVGVLLINHGGMPFRIDPGMRIAQLVMSKFETISWQVVEELPTSERGEKGFGSSGV